MANENPEAQSAEGGGSTSKARSSSMYDPARDSWEAQESSAVPLTQLQPSQSISALNNPPAQEILPSVSVSCFLL